MPKRKTAKKKVLKDTPQKERHFGVILEDIHSKLDLIVESHQSFDRKITELERRNFKLEEVILRLDVRSAKTDLELGDLRREAKSSADTILKYLSRIDDELQEIKSEIKELKRELVKKADLLRLESLEKRVAKMELILEKRLVNA